MWKRRHVQKRRPNFLLKISAAIFLLLIIALVFFLNKVGLFTVRQVDVQAEQLGCTNADQIKTVAALFGQNFFTVDKDKLIRSLEKKFICIKDISFTKVFPGKVQMQITARQAAAILANLKSQPASASALIENAATPSASEVQDLYIVDSSGVVFAKGTDETSIPKIYSYNLNPLLGQKINSDLISGCLKILDKIKTLGVTVQESWISDDFFIANPDGKFTKIIFRLNDQIDIQLASLQLILDTAKIDAKELEFIDLRFDKPIVRYAPKKRS